MVDQNCGTGADPRHGDKDGNGLVRRERQEAARDPPSDVEARFAAQMFDLTSAFIREFLGPRLKYSCAYYQDGAETPEEAKAAAPVLFASGGGETWGVSRYRLKPTGALG